MYGATFPQRVEGTVVKRIIKYCFNETIFLKFFNIVAKTTWMSEIYCNGFREKKPLG
jgi:hypothetical protein